MEEVGDHPEAGFQEFQFLGVGAMEIAPSLLAGDSGKRPGAGDLEAMPPCLLQVVRADLRAIPEVEGGVLEEGGDGFVCTSLDVEAGPPVIAEPQPFHLALLPQDDGEPGA